jgi:DNA-directed RNA polymerase subunit RPC12/RpoP
MRPLRKRLTRRRFRRVGPPSAIEAAAAGASAPEAAPPPIMRCMCGIILEIGVEDYGQRKSCAACRRRFEVQISYDLGSGRNNVQIHYLTDRDVRTGETCVVAQTITSGELPAMGREPEEESSLPREPEPPQDSLYKCACGSLLLVDRKHYDRRVRCPECGVRMVVFMLWNPAADSFLLQTFNLVDDSSGATQILTKL